MKKNSLVLAGVAMAALLGGVGASYAQTDDEMMMMHKRKPMYRPLKVTPRPAPAPVAAPVVAGPGDALGGALAAPVTGLTGAIGGPVGVAGGIAGGAITGATNLAFAPLAGLTGGAVGISPIPAPPLPVVARYAGTGKVVESYDEGYAQPVPVDASGPIYKIDYKADGVRTVTPFSILAFPVQGLTYGLTAPFRPR